MIGKTDVDIKGGVRWIWPSNRPQEVLLSCAALFVQSPCVGFFFHGGREIARLCLCSADGPYCGHLYLWLPRLPLFCTSISLLCDYEVTLWNLWLAWSVVPVIADSSISCSVGRELCGFFRSYIFVCLCPSVEICGGKTQQLCCSPRKLVMIISWWWHSDEGLNPSVVQAYVMLAKCVRNVRVQLLSLLMLVVGFLQIFP